MRVGYHESLSLHPSSSFHSPIHISFKVNANANANANPAHSRPPIVVLVLLPERVENIEACETAKNV
jgi:hypothetical protein